MLLRTCWTEGDHTYRRSSVIMRTMRRLCPSVSTPSSARSFSPSLVCGQRCARARGGKGVRGCRPVCWSALSNGSRRVMHMEANGNGWWEREWNEIAGSGACGGSAASSSRVERSVSMNCPEYFSRPVRPYISGVRSLFSGSSMKTIIEQNCLDETLYLER